ncbi:hypothetical protein AA0311_2580 [Asaia bogorensis NBRC 16594]|uniref:Uncharacterized protein n=1 Tax=Asaia bogorensis NBRC 16594 TaxID=1231624 RepID=A0AAN4U4I0_9PROT|nr:hypothetical protein AA0311_2580 [Asaia bogorensis NBRC 16594]GEL54910.1 hypothetical protein ABO01nite_29170 [Asaia bogorensis NBRC 16594]
MPDPIMPYYEVLFADDPKSISPTGVCTVEKARDEREARELAQLKFPGRRISEVQKTRER